MTGVFLTVLRMSLTGSAVILAVLLVRLCLKKAPKRWSWALWLIVLFRLLTPFGIPLSVAMPDPFAGLSAGVDSAWTGAEPSAVSEFSESAVSAPGPTNPANPDEPKAGAGKSSAEVYAPDPASTPPSAYGESAAVGGGKLSEGADPLPEADRADLWDRVLTGASCVWLAGVVLLAGWNLLSYRKLKKRLSEAVPSGGEGLYLTDRVDSAFVVGLIRPRIYLPTGLTPVEQACVAAHERVHIRRLDPWRRFLSFLALTVHWFNPLVWLAFSLSGKDMELSCDEAVLNRAMNRIEGQEAMTDDIRAAYARTLVKFASRGRIAGPALAFGEGETTGRVKNVMRYKKPVLWVSIAAGLVLVLSAAVLAVNLTARDTSLLNTVYAVKKGTFPALEEDEPGARLMEGMSSLRYMLAGDGSFYVRGSDSEAWDYNGKPEVWIEDGKIVSDLIQDIASPEDLSAMIRETSGVNVGRIADARVLLTEPYSPNHSVYTAFFSTTNGKYWYAFIGGRESLGRGNVLILLELAPEAPVSGGDSGFFANSLRTPVMTLLSWEVESEVFIYNSITDAAGRSIQLFLAGEELYAHIGQPDNERPFHFGIAVFLPEAEGKGLRLADCAICPDVTVTHPFRYAGIADPAEPGTVRRDGDDFVFLTEDGQSIRASLTLPERKKTFHGKTEYIGECSIRFPGNAEEAYEVPAFLDALPYTRYSVEEMLYHIRNLTPEQSEFLSGRQFEIAGNCSLWVTDWEDTWSYIGKGTLNPILENRSVEEWILEQTGVEVELVKEARLFSGQMHSGTILFSTRDGGFYAATVYPGDEPDSPECRSLFRLRCETDPGNRLWIDEGFAERTLQSALERDVHVPALHTAYPPGIAVVPFVTGMMWKDISGLVSYDADKISCQIGAAVFELGSRSARLLKWSVFEDVSFAGWYPERDMITCEFPSDDTILFTLPDGTSVNGAAVRADLTLPERKSRFFGLIEQKQLVGECSIGFRVDGIPNPADPSAEEPAEDGTEAAPDQNPYPDLDLLSPRRESWKLFPYKEGMAEYIRLVPDQAGLTEEKLAAVDSELLMKREDGEYWIFDYLYGDGWTGEDVLACLAIGPGELAAVDVFQKSGNTFEGTLTDPDALTALYDAIAQSDVMTRTLWADEIGWSERSQTEEGHAAEKILELRGPYGKVARLFFYPHADLMWLGDSAVALPRGEGVKLLGLFEDAFGREDTAESTLLRPSDGTREQIDAAYDAFLAEHYELEDMSSYLAAYATRRIDLNGDGWKELVVYRMPTESSYPLDIYEYSRSYEIVRAFHTTLEGIPPSLNADPSGFWCAQIGAHDAERPDGFYGDFFTFGDQTYLISMDASEFWKKLECHAFTTVSGSLAAQTIFSAERYGEWYHDETKRNRSFVNGQEIPYDSFDGALLDWRKTWAERTGGDGEALCQKPLWSEAEVSGWPFGWIAEQREKTAETYFPTGHFTLTHPAQWGAARGRGELSVSSVEWLMEYADSVDYPLAWQLEFRLGGGSREYMQKDTLGWLKLYAHRLGRVYPSAHQELATVVFPDGTAWDLAVVFPREEDIAPENEVKFAYELNRLRTAAASIRFDDDCRVTLPYEAALSKLMSALEAAFTNTYGYDPEPPLEEDPSPATDEEYLRWAIFRFRGDGEAAGAWEDENYYWFPVIFPFAVDKETGEIYKVYEGWDPAAKESYTHLTPFDPRSPDALSFAG